MIQNKLIGILIFALLSIGSAFFLKTKLDEIKELKSRNEAYRSNQQAYYNIINGKMDENRVLRLTVDDLRNSKDSLINYIEKEKKSRKSPKNRAGSITAVAVTEIHDTVIIELPVITDFKIDTTVNYNELTSTRIKIEKKSLISSIRVNNIVDLYVYPTREYVNNYRNGFIRLINFDWRKQNVYEYQIHNSNKLVKNVDVRVYEVDK